MLNISGLYIRPSTAQDLPIIYDVVKISFATAEHSDGHEQDLVLELVKCDAFIPALSLVAEVDNTIVGYALFTEAQVGETSVLVLAPVAVLPTYQKQGIGESLIQKGHKIAKSLGYGHSVVLGDPVYYSRFGYQPARLQGISAPFDVPAEYFMVLSLQEGQQRLQGVMRYAAPFGIES